MQDNLELSLSQDMVARIAQVCFVADPFDPAGHERYGGGHLFLFDLGRFLVQTGYHVTFFTRRNAPHKPEFDELGPLCSIYRLAVGPPEELPPATVGEQVDQLSTAFASLLDAEKLKFSAFHSHYWIAGEVVRRFCAGHPSRHVHSILSLGRSNRERGEPCGTIASLRDACEIRVFNAVDALVAVCPTELADLTRLYPEVDCANTHIIPYGVEPDVFYPRPQSERDSVCRQTRGFAQGPWAAPRIS